MGADRLAVWKKRHGIGRQLLNEAAQELARRRFTDSRFYLWVLDWNTAAQSFYAACGGAKVEITLCDSLPGGGSALKQRIVWPDAVALGSFLSRSM